MRKVYHLVTADIQREQGPVHSKTLCKMFDPCVTDSVEAEVESQKGCVVYQCSCYEGCSHLKKKMHEII